MGVSIENRAVRPPSRRPPGRSRPRCGSSRAEPLLGPLEGLDLSGIDWLIAGGESGPRHRRIDPRWVRDLRDRCVDAEVAFFFKQWGGTRPKSNGRLLEGRTWDELPAGRPLVA